MNGLALIAELTATSSQQKTATFPNPMLQERLGRGSGAIKVYYKGKLTCLQVNNLTIGLIDCLQVRIQPPFSGLNIPIFTLGIIL